MSITVNVGEYGIALNFNVNYDVSAATSLALNITRPDGTLITGTPSPATRRPGQPGNTGLNAATT